MADAQAVAEAVGRAFIADDRILRFFGITLAAISPGKAKVRLAVKPEMANPHDLCHGGIIFALADTALGFASNSRNVAAVTQHCTISFMAPSRPGDVLEAEAAEISRAGRNVVYDVIVRNQAGAAVAVFRGTAFERGGASISGGANHG